MPRITVRQKGVSAMAAKRSTANAADSGVIGQVKERASEVGNLVKSSARLAKDEATQRISKVTQALKEEAARVAKDQKDWAAGEIGSVGSAIHEAARKLHDSRIDAVAEYVDAAAQRFDDVAHYLEDHELSELVEPVADVVRRHPMAFVGGFLAAGILLGRFLKAGEPPPVPTRQAGAKSRNGGGGSTSSRNRKRKRS